jgi:hypothetical protein
MIDVRMRNQDEKKRLPLERALKGVDVVRRPGAGIDERGHPALEQPRVVAGRARPRGGVPGRDQERHQK